MPFFKKKKKIRKKKFEEQIYNSYGTQARAQLSGYC